MRSVGFRPRHPICDRSPCRCSFRSTSNRSNGVAVNGGGSIVRERRRPRRPNRQVEEVRTVGAGSVDVDDPDSSAGVASMGKLLKFHLTPVAPTVALIATARRRFVAIDESTSATRYW